MQVNEMTQSFFLLWCCGLVLVVADASNTDEPVAQRLEIDLRARRLDTDALDSIVYEGVIGVWPSNNDRVLYRNVIMDLNSHVLWLPEQNCTGEETQSILTCANNSATLSMEPKTNEDMVVELNYGTNRSAFVHRTPMKLVPGSGFIMDDCFIGLATNIRGLDVGVLGLAPPADGVSFDLNATYHLDVYKPPPPTPKTADSSPQNKTPNGGKLKIPAAFLKNSKQVKNTTNDAPESTLEIRASAAPFTNLFYELFRQQINLPIFTVYLKPEIIFSRAYRNGRIVYGGFDTEHCEMTVTWNELLHTQDQWATLVDKIQIGDQIRERVAVKFSLTANSIKVPRDVFERLNKCDADADACSTSTFTLWLHGRRFVVPTNTTNVLTSLEPTDDDVWILGQPFHRAYCVLFDLATRRIGLAKTKA